MKMKCLFCERDCQTAIPDLRFAFYVYTAQKSPFTFPYKSDIIYALMGKP